MLLENSIDFQGKKDLYFRDVRKLVVSTFKFDERVLFYTWKVIHHNIQLLEGTFPLFRLATNFWKGLPFPI